MSAEHRSYSLQDIAHSGRSSGGNLVDFSSCSTLGRALSCALFVCPFFEALSSPCLILLSFPLSHDNRFTLYATTFVFPFSSSSKQLSSLDITSSNRISAAIPRFFVLNSAFSNASVRFVSFYKNDINIRLHNYVTKSQNCRNIKSVLISTLFSLFSRTACWLPNFKVLKMGSGEASPTIWSCYANFSVFIDYKRINF